MKKHQMNLGVFKRVLILALSACLYSAMFPVSASPQTAGSQQAPQDKQPRQSIAAPVPTKAWTGDLDVLLKHRIIRALVVYSKTQYYAVKGVQFGTSYDSLKAFETYINAKYPAKTKNLRYHVVIIPVPRDQLLSRLVEGRGDLAVAGLTVTPERQKIVDFSDPVLNGISQIAVTGPGSPELHSLDDLSGKEVFLRRNSSYWENVEKLNVRFKQEGKALVKLRAAPGDMEDEDLLEMLNAGIVEIVIVNDYAAKLWAGMYKNIRPHADIAVNTGGEFAWAMRKDSPQLQAAVNGFVKTHRAGTAFGNTVIRKYLVNTQMIKNAISPAEIKNYQATVEMFRKYSAEYDVDYLLMMAEGFQESGLNQNAKSQVGAIGVMQLMPATGEQMKVGDIHTADANIHAGVKFIRYMVDKYFANEPMDNLNKTLFAFAAYNAGPGRVHALRVEAAKKGFDPNVWIDNVEVIAAARVGMETVNYVANIYKYYIAYKLLAEREQERSKNMQQAKSPAP
ncbi:MAG: lytic transglycosylase F [Candidatus Acidiferrales bacterium]